MRFPQPSQWANPGLADDRRELHRERAEQAVRLPVWSWPLSEPANLRPDISQAQPLTDPYRHRRALTSVIARWFPTIGVEEVPILVGCSTAQGPFGHTHHRQRLTGISPPLRKGFAQPFRVFVFVERLALALFNGAAESTLVDTHRNG